MVVCTTHSTSCFNRNLNEHSGTEDHATLHRTKYADPSTRPLTILSFMKCVLRTLSFTHCKNQFCCIFIHNCDLVT